MKLTIGGGEECPQAALSSFLGGHSPGSPPCHSERSFLQHGESKDFNLFQGEGLLCDLWIWGP